MPEALAGDLAHVSLASLLQLVESEDLSGTLRCGGGALELAGGQLVGARFLGLSGEDAAAEAMLRARGRFALQLGAPYDAPPLASAQHLILTSFQLLDDLQRFGRWVLAEAGSTSLPADGARSIASLIAAEGLHLVEVLPAVAAAADRGELTPVSTAPDAELDLLWVVGPGTPSAAHEAPPSQPVVTVPVDFDDLLFSARRLTRQRRFDEAEAQLTAALRLRPDSRIVQQNLTRITNLRSTRT